MILVFNNLEIFLRGILKSINFLCLYVVVKFLNFCYNNVFILFYKKSNSNIIDIFENILKTTYHFKQFLNYFYIFRICLL